MPTVSVAKDPNPEKALKKSLELLGGVKALFKPGSFCLIKPNVAYPRPSPITTSATVVGALVKLLKKAKVHKVVVADSTALPTKTVYKKTTKDAFVASGIEEAARRAGAEVLYLDDDEFVEVKIPNAKVLREAKIARSVLEAEVLINLPVMKTHHMTSVSLGIKNLHGVLHDDFKGYAHREDLHQKLADLLKIVKPTLTVIDATTAMEGEGPGAGDPVEMNLIISGADTVAVDATAASIMGFDPLLVKHIRIAHAENLGIADLSQIKILGEKVEKVKRLFKKPEASVIGLYKNVDVYKGGVCSICLAIARNALHSMDKRGILARLERFNLVLGINPTVPLNLDNPTFLIGDCAINSTRDQFKNNTVQIPGCPPFAALIRIREYFTAQSEQR
jgi:uncharacterized protein (DUF362 family)